MRRIRSAGVEAVLTLALASLAACDDVHTPLAASWLEWADSATAGVPFGVRVAGFRTENPASLRIHVSVVRDTITIWPYSVDRPCHDVCLGVLRSYDTLVWVPAIAAAPPRNLVIRAPSHLHTLDAPWPVMTFGTISVSADAPVAPHLRSVGMAVGSSDAVGCFFVSTITASRPIYVSADQPPAWAPGFNGFAYGRTDPVLRSTCRDEGPVIAVDSIIQ